MNEISNKWIGKNTIRPDGADKVTGRAQYSSHNNARYDLGSCIKKSSSTR